MSYPKLLVLVRHAESIGNKLKSLDQIARAELPEYKFQLTKRGIEQSQIIKKYLNKNFGDFDAYFTSYYERAIQTMKLLYPDAKIIEDSRLVKQQLGIWLTMTTQQIKRFLPTEIERKEKEGIYHYHPPGGENWPGVEFRICSFFNSLQNYSNKKVLIVTDLTWLCIFQKLTENLSIEKSVFNFEIGAFENASVTIYENKNIENKPSLVLLKKTFTPWKDKL